MGNVIEPILADCGIYNRNLEEIKEIEEEIRRVRKEVQFFPQNSL